MAEVLDVIEAIEQILVGNHVPTSTDRIDAQKQLRNLLEDRVKTGVRRDSGQRDAAFIRYNGAVTEMLLSGESGCSRSLVEIRNVSLNRRRAFEAHDLIRQLLGGIRTTVSTRDGNLTIGGCIPVDRIEPDPDVPVDGSDDFEFEFMLLFDVTHDIVVSSGIT